MALDVGTRLAIQRTQLAAERTLMAWIRTAFSMISFGFTIGKFLEYLAQQPGGRQPGGFLPGALVVAGLASLLVGTVEYRHVMKSLGAQLEQKYRASPVGIIAVLVGLLGLLAFAGLFFHNKFI